MSGKGGGSHGCIFYIYTLLYAVVGVFGVYLCSRDMHTKA